MSQQNIEVARKSFVAFNARSVDELVQLFDADCEWCPFRAQLEGTMYRGHAGIRQFVRDMDEDWEQYRIDPVEFHDRGERVAAIGNVTARGRSGGADINWLAGFVFDIRAGRLVKVVSHSDPADALQALEDGSGDAV